MELLANSQTCSLQIRTKYQMTRTGQMDIQWMEGRNTDNKYNFLPIP